MENVINLNCSTDSLVRDAVDRLVVNVFLQREKYGHKSFAICGCSPRSGTTSIAVELAVSLASMGWKTVLVDTDLKKDMTKAEHPIKGLYDYFYEQATEKDIIIPTNHKQLYYVSGCNHSAQNSVNILSSIKTEQLIKILYDAYDFVILDTTSFATAVDGKIVCSKADCTLLVVASGETRFAELEAAKKEFEKANANVIGVVTTKVKLDKKKKSRLHIGKKARKLSSLLISVFLFSLAAFSQTCYATESSQEVLPIIMVTEYEIENSPISADSEFEVSITFRNASAMADAYDVYMTIYTSTEGLYLQDNEVNQRFIGYLRQGQESTVTIRMKASENVYSEAGNIQIEFNYVNRIGTPGANTTIITPSVSSKCQMDFLSLTFPENTKLNSRTLLNVGYSNTGACKIQNICMIVEGNIQNSGEPTTLENLNVGTQSDTDYYVTFLESGEQQLNVRFEFQDEEGNLYKSDFRTIVIQVADQESTYVETDNISLIYSYKDIIGLAGILSVILLFLLILRKHLERH